MHSPDAISTLISTVLVLGMLQGWLEAGYRGSGFLSHTVLLRLRGSVFNV